MHFNKGLAGAPPDALAGAKDTATNPVVLDAFALAIVADGEKPCYPGIPGHEPSVDEGRKAAARIDQCVNQLRAVAGDNGAYVSESNYFQKNFQQAYWGPIIRASQRSGGNTILTAYSSCITESAPSNGAPTASKNFNRILFCCLYR